MKGKVVGAPDLKVLVTELYDKGLSLNEILNELVREKGLDITFMDLRLLVSEIEDARNMYDKIDEPEEEEVEEEEIVEEPECTIELNSIVSPGSPMQGTAKFKSGIQMKFMMDNQGRVGIEPIGKVQPTQEEIQFFQEALMEKARSGMI